MTEAASDITPHSEERKMPYQIMIEAKNGRLISGCFLDEADAQNFIKEYRDELKSLMIVGSDRAETKGAPSQKLFDYATGIEERNIIQNAPAFRIAVERNTAGEVVNLRLKGYPSFVIACNAETAYTEVYIAKRDEKSLYLLRPENADSSGEKVIDAEQAIFGLLSPHAEGLSVVYTDQA
jgi:hypothetical protein